eukprot:scaffold101431_cov30-Tisochrysis_lutea.AAC.3
MFALGSAAVRHGLSALDHAAGARSFRSQSERQIDAANLSASGSMSLASDLMVPSTLESSIFFQTGGFLEVRSSWSCALAQTSRHSGSEISSLARSRAGRRTGTKGAIS